MRKTVHALQLSKYWVRMTARVPDAVSRNTVMGKGASKNLAVERRAGHHVGVVT